MLTKKISVPTSSSCFVSEQFRKCNSVLFIASCMANSYVLLWERYPNSKSFSVLLWTIQKLIKIRSHELLLYSNNSSFQKLLLKSVGIDLLFLATLNILHGFETKYREYYNTGVYSSYSVTNRYKKNISDTIIFRCIIRPKRY